MKILVVDDHALFVDAIRPTLERGGATEIVVAHTAQDAIDAAAPFAPDIALVDIGLPDRSGLVVGSEILRLVPGCRVIALTGTDDPAIEREALRSGFAGFLTKDATIRRFLTSLEAVLAGRVVATLTTRAARARHVPARGHRDLTERESEVLDLLVWGVHGDEIARRLGISRNTVRTHIQSVLTKFQVHSRLEAVAYAVRNGLVDTRRSAPR